MLSRYWSSLLSHWELPDRNSRLWLDWRAMHVCSVAATWMLAHLHVLLKEGCLLQIRDKTKPGQWYTVDSLTMVPSEQDIEPNVGDKIGAYFQGLRNTLQR